MYMLAFPKKVRICRSECKNILGEASTGLDPKLTVLVNILLSSETKALKYIYLSEQGMVLDWNIRKHTFASITTKYGLQPE
jgi:hypothetical protein